MAVGMTMRTERATWQNPRILTTLVLVFLTGAMAGAIGMRAGLHEKLHRNAVYWRGGKDEFSYDRLKTELRCADSQAAKIEALKFAVHFVGDIHQPLHTVADAKGGTRPDQFSAEGF